MLASRFHNYQSSRPAAAIRDHALSGEGSPNLASILAFLTYVFGGQNLGYGPNVRAVRGGTATSTHAYGAALDWRYMPADSRKPGDVRWVIESYRAAQEMMQFLVDNSQELGIQAVHDYWGDRIWRSSRSGDVNGGWRKQNGAGAGMGERWASYVHIEVHPDAYFDGRAVTDRVDFGVPVDPEQPPVPEQPAPPAPKPDPEPNPVPPTGAFTVPQFPELRKGHRSNVVRVLQAMINVRNAVRGGPGNVVAEDGYFGDHTEAVVRWTQSEDGLLVDGVVGPRTWTALFNSVK